MSGAVQTWLARSPDDVAHARRLFQGYADHLLERYGFDLSYQGISDEIQGLPGKYAEPLGGILLAAIGDADPCGVIAYRPLELSSSGEPLICEMKRTFVEASARGHSVGDNLMTTLLKAARAAGYRSMKLDTDPELTGAIRLYERHGFTPCARYNADPYECTLYYERTL